MLSSLVKARVPNVGVITRSNYNSLVDHLGGGKDWDLDRKNGGLKILTPFAETGGISFKNKFESLNSVKTYTKHCLQPYCILADANLICNIDFERMLKLHVQKCADITCLYIKSDKVYAEDTTISVGENGEVYDVLYNSEKKRETKNIILKVYILKKELLLDLIEKGVTFGWDDLNKDFIAKNFTNYNIYGFKHEGYCAVMRDINDYYKASMDLLNPKIRQELFQSETDILTKIKDSVPTMYGENSKVTHSLIADGCKIDGNVENCVIFRNATIKSGAEVKDSIIMQDSEIGEDCKISNVISDKNISISPGKVLVGCETLPFVITKGTKL
jgi:glucose-1-phosphate adenylyltransferase